ncbi:extensin family protein [Sphingomonas sp. IC-56]|uniref:extensin-like domain-containing protein n=1 Tax=Sphingomonas sp. IC-56 TaxID=2898529 RepID=UPI001E35A96B|nr:extensin family protein [Sphingomonas sp. IC-56]MCD2324556.1 extensin family protein [Sphingomonas sp. IC-56]
MRLVRWFAVFAPLLLAGCVFGDGDKEPRRMPAARPRGSPPITLNRPTPRETQQCFTDLSREAVRFSPLPDRDFGGGCQVLGAVQLLDVGVPITNIKSMRCPLARSFIGWIRFAVAPAAKQILGSELVRVESMGTYVCRAIVGSSASNRLSEHGLGNAVDIGGFVLADGRKVRVLGGWKSDDEQVREFFEVIHRSACKRFKTVLSPDYNAAHRDHLHLDMGRGPFCA